MLEDRLQLSGMDLDKNAISKIESGQRFVTDIELKALAELFHITTNELLYDEPPNASGAFADGILRPIRA